MPASPCPITRAKHLLGCTASLEDAAGTAHPQVGESHMRHDAKPLLTPALVWQAGSRAAPMPLLLPIPLCALRSKASCPRNRWGGHAQAKGQIPCPALGFSYTHKGPCRWDGGRKAPLPLRCHCARRKCCTRGRNVTQEHLPGGRGWLRHWLMLARAPRRAAPNQHPQALNPHPGPHSQPRRLQICPLAGDGEGWWLSPRSWDGQAI